MPVNPRRKSYLKKKIAAYLLILGFLIAFAFFLNIYFNFNKQLFISPVGKINVDTASIEKNLKDKHILFSGVALEGNTYLVNISNNGQVRFSSDKDIGKQISSLQRILIQLTIEGKPFKSIDFRFEEPIISF